MYFNNLFIFAICVFIFFLAATWQTYPENKSKFALFVFYGLVVMTVLVVTPLAKALSHFSIFALAQLKEGAANWRHILLPVHIILATPCTLFGPFLLYEPYRKKFPKIHRQVGKLYVLGTLVSAILVLPLSLTNNGGVVAQIGFSTMAVLWFSFTLKAYTAIINKRVVEHSHYMMRSYAMTFAFVHVNVTYGWIDAYGWVKYDPIGVKILQSYASWIFNLIIVEIYIRRKFISTRVQKLISPKPSDLSKHNSNEGSR